MKNGYQDLLLDQMIYKVKDITGFEYLLVSSRKPCLGTTSHATPGSNTHPGAGSAQCLEISLKTQCTEPEQRLSSLSTPQLWPTAVGAPGHTDSTHIKHPASCSMQCPSQVRLSPAYRRARESTLTRAPLDRGCESQRASVPSWGAYCEVRSARLHRGWSLGSA